MKSLIFFVFVVISGVICDISKQDCIEFFLENKEIEEDEDAEICAKINTKLIDDFKGYFKNPELEETIQNCIYDVLDEYKISNLYLKGLLNHLENKTDHDTYEFFFNKTQKYLIRPTATLCADPGVTPFDEPKYSQLAAKRNSHDNLCKQKHLIEQNIIDATDYNIDLSTLKVEDCDEIIKKVDNSLTFLKNVTFQNTFNLEGNFVVRDCIFDKLFKESFAHHKESFNVIATFQLSLEQRKQMRAKMHEWYQSMAKIELTCFQTIL